MGEFGSAEWQFQMYTRLGVRATEMAVREMSKLTKSVLKEALAYRKALVEAKDPFSAAQKIVGDNAREALNALDKANAKGVLGAEYEDIKLMINDLSKFENLNDAAFNGAALNQIKEHINERLQLFKTDKTAFFDIHNELKDIVNASKTARMGFDPGRNPADIIADAKIRFSAKNIAGQIAKEIARAAKAAARNAVKDDLVRSLF